MARKLDSKNGRVSGEDANTCEKCGAPVHPSLECKRCHK